MSSSERCLAAKSEGREELPARRTSKTRVALHLAHYFLDALHCSRKEAEWIDRVPVRHPHTFGKSSLQL
jgi:hypothetical protein